MPKIHGYTMRVGSYHSNGQPNENAPKYKCVDVLLTSMRTNEDVFWSKRGNSYVLVVGPMESLHMPDGTPVQLLSVNGIGEVRWPVWLSRIEDALKYEKEGRLDPTWDSAEQLEAARHFGIVEAKKL